MRRMLLASLLCLAPPAVAAQIAPSANYHGPAAQEVKARRALEVVAQVCERVGRLQQALSEVKIEWETVVIGGRKVEAVVLSALLAPNPESVLSIGREGGLVRMYLLGNADPGISLRTRAAYYLCNRVAPVGDVPMFVPEPALGGL